MKDYLPFQYGTKLRAPQQVAFDLTYRCNLRCLHCFNSSGENLIMPSELSDEDVLKFITEISSLGLLNVCFCGGEPLIRKGLLEKCCRILKNAGTQVSVVSNGLLADSETMKKLVEAGLTNIQFSVDGLKHSHDKLRNKTNAFESVMQSLRNSADLDIQIAVAFTPTSFNIDEIEEVYSLLTHFNLLFSRKKPIRLRLQPLMLMGRASDNSQDLLPDEKQYRKFVNTVNRLRKKVNKDVTIDWGDPVDHLIRFTSRKLVIPTTNIHANGDIIVSPYIPLVVGNIKRHSLVDYWEAGLFKIWDYSVVKKLAENIKCIHDMYTLRDKLPAPFREKEIYIDLIDDDLNDTSSLSKYEK